MNECSRLVNEEHTKRAQAVERMVAHFVLPDDADHAHDLLDRTPLTTHTLVETVAEVTWAPFNPFGYL